MILDTKTTIVLAALKAEWVIGIKSEKISQRFLNDVQNLKEKSDTHA